MPKREFSQNHPPRAAFAMRSNTLRDELFPPDTLACLVQVADLASTDVLTEFDSAASRSVLAEVDALITGWGAPRIDASVLAHAPHLTLVAHAAGTVRSIVDPICWELGVSVTSAAQANALPVAEYTLAMIILAGKRAFLAHDLLQAHRHAFDPGLLPSNTGNHGTTVGIIGASRVGRLVIERLRPFDFRVLLSDPTVTSADASQLGVDLVDLDVLMASSDIVSVHAPLLPATRGMIGARQIAALRDGSTLVNTARGAIIDQSALLDRLRSGAISAVLDVTDPEHLAAADELYDLTNVFLTPHIAGSMGNETARLGLLAAAEIERLSLALPFVHPIRVGDLGSIG